MEDFKKDINSYTLIVGDFNTSLSTMTRSSKQRINDDIVALNNTLDQMDLIDFFTEPFTPKKQNIHSFQMHMEHFQRCTTSLKQKQGRSQNKPEKLKKIEIISSIFSDHNGLRDPTTRKKLKNIQIYGD